jgi:hypothetical protein
LRLAPRCRELGLHLTAYSRKFHARFGAELQNLRFYRAHSLTECRHRRRQCVESFHGVLQTFYAIRQQFIRHHSSVPTRRFNLTRAFDGRTSARRMPTTLPSSHRVDNCFRPTIGRWRCLDAMSTFEMA